MLSKEPPIKRPIALPICTVIWIYYYKQVLYKCNLNFIDIPTRSNVVLTTILLNLDVGNVCILIIVSLFNGPTLCKRAYNAHF